MNRLVNSGTEPVVTTSGGSNRTSDSSNGDEVDATPIVDDELATELIACESFDFGVEVEVEVEVETGLEAAVPTCVSTRR